MARLSSVIFERAQRKRKNDDVRVKFLFIVGSGINASKMVCACKHFNCVVSVASTVNAARLVTHLTQQCPKAPGIIKEIAQQSSQGAKKIKKMEDIMPGKGRRRACTSQPPCSRGSARSRRSSWAFLAGYPA